MKIDLDKFIEIPNSNGYYINENGEVYNNKRNRLLTAQPRKDIVMKDGSKKRFYIPKLVNELFDKKRCDALKQEYLDKGFKEIELFENYVINEDGVVINTNTERRAYVSLCEGLLKVHVYNAKKKFSTTLSLDKLLRTYFGRNS